MYYKVILVYLLFVALSPLFFLGDYYIEVHDNLDSSIAWLSSMKENNVFFGTGQSLPFLNGISRDYLPSELQLNNLIFNFFSPLNAYVLCAILKFFIGCFSFLYLIKTLGYKRDVTVVIIACLFALLPGYPNLYFAQVTIPLILALIIRYAKSGSLKFALFILIYPVFSEFARYGLILLGYCFLATVIYLFYNRSYSKRLFVVLLLLSISYISTEYHFFYIYLISDVDSIRSVMVAPVGSAFTSFVESLIRGQYHAQSSHYVVLILLAFYLAFVIKRNIVIHQDIKVILTLILFNCLIYSLYDVVSIRDALAFILPPLKGWNYSRTIWFNPILWWVVFVILFQIMGNRISPITKSVLITLAVISVTLIPSYNNDFSKTIRCHVLGCNSLSYNEFISEDLFNEVKSTINYNNEKVASFGFPPSVLVFNKFSTVDMYHNAYDLEYKEKFRDLIAPIISENLKWRQYFDNWGGRAYLYPLESDAKCYSSMNLLQKSNLSCTAKFDVAIAKKMDIKYVISAYPISIDYVDLVSEIKNESYNIYIYAI
ncbi:DUF6044 family protein [Vibrio cyclitrophicus]